MKIRHLFDNIKLTYKMGLIALLALIALSVPTYFYYTLSISNQHATELELQGVEPANATVILKKLLAEHRGLSSVFFGGDTSIKNTLSAKTTDVEKQFSLLKNDIISASNATVITDLFDEIYDEWKSVTARVGLTSYTSDQSFSEHSRLIELTDGLTAVILRNYTLSYDPDPASYHIIIASFENLPRLGNTIGKIRGYGAGILARGNITASEVGILRGYTNSVSTPINDFAYNLRSAGEADATFTHYIQKANEFAGRVAELEALTEQELLKEQNINYSANLYFEQYSSLLRELYAFNNASVNELKNLLNNRIDAFAAQRQTSITIILFMVLASVFVGTAITMSIKNSAISLIGYFKRISSGDYDITFDQRRSDEMGVLETELCVLNAQLKTASVKALEAKKVKQALDNSTTCFMMSDADGHIVYINDAIISMFTDIESTIRTEIPQFDIQSLIGSNIKHLYKNASEYNDSLRKMTEKLEIELPLGGRFFRLVVHLIKSDKLEQLGHSIEWHDMTDIYEEQRRVTRILESLDCTSTNVMIADANRNIIYLNRAAIALLNECEADFRCVLPQFVAKEVLGSNMDAFHTNPAHQKQVLEGLTKRFISPINIGKRHFRLAINPIISERGERLGSVIEWLDRTNEVEAEHEIATMVKASVAGNFTHRIEENDKTGFLLTMAQGLNQLVNTTEKGLDEVSDVLLAISKGDLTHRIQTEYQGTFEDLKSYCNITGDKLVQIITEIRDASETIRNASSEIARGNNDLSNRTEQQAASLQQTASSMEQITSTVRLNAESAKEANNLAFQATEVATSGGKLIKEVVVTMASISQSSTKIADIISVIDGIAFQTNILALNAAVEAARAGEQGRGFAVVASEIRTLAQRCANAAKDIKTLISESSSKVESGNKLVESSGSTMQQIVLSIQKVSTLMNDIASASEEQATGVDEVGKAVLQMDEMTQQNSALVEQAAVAAESMSAQATALAEQVGTFHLNDTSIITSPSIKKLSSKQTFVSSRKDEDEWESF